MDLTKHFSDTSVIKDKSVSIIGEYDPVTHNPDALGENSKIERETGLPPNASNQRQEEQMGNAQPT